MVKTTYSKGHRQKVVTKKQSKPLTKRVVEKQTSAVTAIDLDKAFCNHLTTLTSAADKAAQGLTKEADALKKQLTKAQAKKKSTKDKHAVLKNKAKAKPTKALEAQLEKANAAYGAASQELDAIKSQLEPINSQLKIAKLQQNKFSGLVKTIDTFNQAWEKN